MKKIISSPSIISPHISQRNAFFSNWKKEPEALMKHFSESPLQLKDLSLPFLTVDYVELFKSYGMDAETALYLGGKLKSIMAPTNESLLLIEDNVMHEVEDLRLFCISEEEHKALKALFIDLEQVNQTTLSDIQLTLFRFSYSLGVRPSESTTITSLQSDLKRKLTTVLGRDLEGESLEDIVLLFEELKKGKAREARFPLLVFDVYGAQGNGALFASTFLSCFQSDNAINNAEVKVEILRLASLFLMATWANDIAKDESGEGVATTHLQNSLLFILLSGKLDPDLILTIEIPPSEPYVIIEDELFFNEARLIEKEPYLEFKKKYLGTRPWTNKIAISPRVKAFAQVIKGLNALHPAQNLEPLGIASARYLESAVEEDQNKHFLSSVGEYLSTGTNTCALPMQEMFMRLLFNQPKPMSFGMTPFEELRCRIIRLDNDAESILKEAKIIGDFDALRHVSIGNMVEQQLCVEGDLIWAQLEKSDYSPKRKLEIMAKFQKEHPITDAISKNYGLIVSKGEDKTLEESLLALTNERNAAYIDMNRLMANYVVSSVMMTGNGGGADTFHEVGFELFICRWPEQNRLWAETRSGRYL